MRTATQKEIDYINANRAKDPLAAEDVFVEAFLLANTSYIGKYSMFMHPKAVKQTAEKAGSKDGGVNFKVMHERDKVVSLGKSFAGAFDKASNTAFAKFFFPKGLSENGYTVDDLVRGLSAGVYDKTSWGIAWPMKDKSMECSLCGGNPLYLRTWMSSDAKFCGHWPGDQYEVTEAMADFIAKKKGAGMDSYPDINKVIKVGDKVEARMWMMDTEDGLKELSLVDQGASDSRPVNESEIPVKFAEVKELPAFKFAEASHSNKAMDAVFFIDAPMNTGTFEGDDSPEDKKMLGEHNQQTIGGERKVDKKDEDTIMTRVEAAISALKGKPAPEASASDLRLKEMETLLATVGYDGKDLQAFVASVAAFKQDAESFKKVPEDLRTRVEKTEISWAEVSNYVKACETELDAICTEVSNAAVASLGNETDTKEIVAGIKMKAKVLGLEAALAYGKQMVEAYEKKQTIVPGQKTDPATTEEETPEVIAAKKKEKLAQMSVETAKKYYGYTEN